MAIDTEKKRASTVALSLYCMGPSVRPDGGLDAGDRQVVGYGYIGITPTVAAVVPQHIGHNIGEQMPTEPNRSNVRRAGS